MNNILGYISLTGLFLSLVILFYNRGYTGSNRFLGSFFFFASLYTMGLCIGMYGDSVILSALLGPTTIPFFYLIGPFSYLYVRSVLRDNPKLSKYDYLHFALFFIQVGGLMPYYLSSWDHKMEIAGIIQSDNWTLPYLAVNVLPSKINLFLRPLQMTVYLVVQWYLVWKYQWSERSSVPSVQLKSTKRWLIIFLGISTLWFINTMNIIVDHLRYRSRSEFLSHVQPALILAGAILVILTVSLLMFPQVMYGLPRIATVKPGKPGKDPGQDPGQDAATRLNDLQTRLECLMVENQPFLDPEFSINSLSVQLKIPVHHIRYYFSQHLNISFTTYKNRLRVDYVKMLIEKGEEEKHSVEGLGHLAGFSSKSSFFAAFKTETGMTPLEYHRSLNTSANTRL